MPPVRKCWWVRLTGAVGYSPGPEGGFGKAREISTGSPARLEPAFLWTEQLHHPPPDPASEASPTSKVSDGPSSCEGLFSSGPELGSGPGAPAIKASLASSLWVCAPYTLCRPEKPWLCLTVVQLLKLLRFILLAFLILLEAPYKKLPSSHE